MWACQKSAGEFNRSVTFFKLPVHLQCGPGSNCRSIGESLGECSFSVTSEGSTAPRRGCGHPEFRYRVLHRDTSNNGYHSHQDCSLVSTESSFSGRFFSFVLSVLNHLLPCSISLYGHSTATRKSPHPSPLRGPSPFFCCIHNPQPSPTLTLHRSSASSMALPGSPSCHAPSPFNRGNSRQNLSMRRCKGYRMWR